MDTNNKIYELIKKHNYSQEQLEEKLNVTRQTISKWELNETSPDINQSKKLSKIFNISLDELTNNNITNYKNKKEPTKIIIDILKILLLSIIIVLIILLSIIFFKEYFDVKPVSTNQTIECIIDEKTYTYEIIMNNETSYIIDKINTNDSEIKLDNTKYTNIKDIFDDIKENVISRGGTCNNY